MIDKETFLESLSTILDCAQSHVDDIETGIEEGIYDKAENQDLGDKEKALETVRAWYAENSRGDAEGSKPDRSEILASLKNDGLTIGECITALAVPNDDPYVVAARQLVDGGNDVEIDDNTTTSVGEDGAWVLGWLWGNNKEAGILGYTELLEKVLNDASNTLDSGKHGLDAEAEKLRRHQADWLEDLITNYADEIDGIADLPVKNLPGPINWIDGEGNTVSFMSSDALNQLRLLARQGGLPDDLANQAERFCIEHGNKLDAILFGLTGGAK